MLEGTALHLILDKSKYRDREKFESNLAAVALFATAALFTLHPRRQYQQYRHEAGHLRTMKL